jgi:hypothetical protein
MTPPALAAHEIISFTNIYSGQIGSNDLERPTTGRVSGHCSTGYRCFSLLNRLTKTQVIDFTTIAPSNN